MFQQEDRYDLSEVGRFKLNQRLGIDKETSKLLTLKDIVHVVKEIIRLNTDPEAESDDTDNLSRRRVRALGELLQIRLRVGFTRVRRIAQDRMATPETEDIA